MGTLAVNQVIAQGVNNNGKRQVDAFIAGSTTYATGGDTLPYAPLGLKTIDKIYQIAYPIGFAGILGGSGLSVCQAGTNDALKLLYYDTNGTEVTAGTNLSTRQVTVLRFVGN